MFTEINWYIAEVVMEITITGETRNVVHRNLVLISANSAEEAFEKSERCGKNGETSYENPRGQLVSIRFRGLASLDAMYEDLEDGAELTFHEYVSVPQNEIEEWIATKDRLGVFRQPKESIGPDYSSKEVLEMAVENIRNSK